jgi:hypothetical protein
MVMNVGYIEENLTTGETILYRTGLHWIALLVPGLFGGPLVLLGLFMLIAGVATNNSRAKPPQWSKKAVSVSTTRKSGTLQRAQSGNPLSLR